MLFMDAEFVFFGNWARSVVLFSLSPPPTAIGFFFMEQGGGEEGAPTEFYRISLRFFEPTFTGPVFFF